MSESVTIDPFTFFALIFLGGFFIYLGWTHRVSQQAKTKATKRTVGPRLLAPSLFVVIGSGEYGLAITLVLAFGIAGASFLFGLAVAMLIISFMMNRIFENVTKPSLSSVSYGGYQSITTPDFIFSKFGRLASMSATTITVIAFWGILLLQFLVGGTIISALSGASEFWSIGLMAVVVAIYTSLGGFSALYFTDFWQSFFMWLAFIIATFVLFSIHGDIPTFSAAYESFKASSMEHWTTDIVIYLFVITVVAAFSGPDLWQRANMASNVKEAKLSLRIAGLGVVAFGLLVSYFSVDIQAVLSTQNTIDEGNELKQYLSLVVSAENSLIPAELVWPEWLRIVFAIGLLSAFVSTADTSAMLVATAIQNEAFRNRAVVVESNNSTTVVIIALSCFSAAFVSLYTSDIAEKFTAILGILGVLGIPTFLALFNRGNKLTFLFAVASGAILLITQTFYFPQFNEGAYLFIPFLPGLLGLFFSSGDGNGEH